MQFRVPQNIAIEDRIVGPLTVIQFAIVVVGGMISFLLFTSLGLPSPLNQLAAGTTALLTIILAIGKFNDQPMYRFFRYVLLFLITPRVRVWHKKGGEIQLIRPTQTKATEDKGHTVKKVSKSDIHRLAEVLDSRGVKGVPPKVTPPPA